MKRSHALTLGAAALAACVRPARSAAAPLTTIKVGVSADEDFAEGYYAQDRGFYAQAGLDAQLLSLSNGGALTAAVISGSLDVATTNTGSMAAAHAHGIPLVLVAPEGVYDDSKLTAALVVPKSSPIRNAKDLTGKRIAVTTLHTLYHTCIRNWIDANGGNSYSVEYVEIPLSGQIPAMLAGRVDAVGTVEPWISQSQSLIRILGIPYASVAKRFMISGWVTTPNWASRNGETLKAFLAVMKRTAVWANANPDAVPPILAKAFGIPIQQILSVPRATMGTTLDPRLIQPVIDVEYKYKLIPERFSAAELFYQP